MTLWQKIHLLARYNDLLSRSKPFNKQSDYEFVVECVDGLQGLGKLNDLEIEEYLESWKIKKINKIYEKTEVKITDAIYNAKDTQNS